MLQDSTILCIGGAVTLAGLLLMLVCNLLKNRLVKQAMLGREGIHVPGAVGRLWNEVGLGVVLTGAVLFFAWLCFRSDLAPRIAWPISYLASVLCGIGCFVRSRTGMNALGLTRDEGANPVPVAVFPEERNFLAILAGFSLGLSGFLAGLLTLGWWVFQLASR